MKPITILKKELSAVEGILSDVNDLIDKGSNFYLGDPIFKSRRMLKYEVFKLKEKIKETELKSKILSK